MSYFIGSFQAEERELQKLEDSLYDLIPEIASADFFKHFSRETYISIYGIKKAINDRFLIDKANGSWIALIGTPLVDFRNEEEEKIFLYNFFKDPILTIRSRIDGCWCILAYDAISGFFYACTDYNNTIPIYYSIKNKAFYFSSHELSLARFLQSKIDPLGFSMAIHLMLTWGSCSRFQDIKKLNPAHLMIYKKSGNIQIKPFWTASEERLWNNKFNDIIDNWIQILKGSVFNYYKVSRGAKVLCDITGGEDARLILSTVHNLGIPYMGTVDGNEDDLDVIIAKRIAQKGGFGLFIRPKSLLSEELLLSKVMEICLFEDGYQDFFSSYIDYSRYLATPRINYDYIKYCGDPGGEIYRGSYYLRGKAIFPNSFHKFDYIFFTKMKFLLDFIPDLVQFPQEEIINVIYKMVEQTLQEVADFPIGTKIDHILRIFQVCNMGLIYKIPRYKPLASRELTKSVYNIPPKIKMDGKLTKACTEILFPEIAWVKTQKGVPTIKKSFLRSVLFIPEYLWTIKFIANGAITRLFKIKTPRKPNLNWERNSGIIRSILTSPPYSNWFRSCESMLTGSLFNPTKLNSLLSDAKLRKTYLLPTLGRIIHQELASRWVYKDFN